MKAPWLTAPRWREFGTLFSVQLIQYLFFCLSIIVVSRGNYLLTIVTDTIFGLNNYFLIRKIATIDPKNPLGLIGYTAGGTCGSLLAIWITKHMHV